MPARVVVLLAGLGLIVFGAVRLSDHRACERGATRAFEIGSGGLALSESGEAARAVLEHCRGARRLTPASEALGQRGQAAPAGALAREAVRREPEWWLSWRAEAQALQRSGDLVGAERARGRARALNPRWRSALPATEPVRPAPRPAAAAGDRSAQR